MFLGIDPNKIYAMFKKKADLVNGKIPANELPSYVDDVIEGYFYEGAFYSDSEHTTQITPESGKIYIDLSSNLSYRWSGSAYVMVGGQEMTGLTAEEVDELWG